MSQVRDWLGMTERSTDGATALVVGLGDLGGRVIDALAREAGIERLIAAGRDHERGVAIAGQAALAAEFARGPRSVEYEPCDLEDVAATAALLERADPEVIVTAASYRTWWRSPDPLPYSAWLPLHLRPVRRLMEARAAAGARGRVVCLPFPDVVIPVLHGVGLAPDAGAGNVAEVAAKLAALAGAAHAVRREEVEVRLVMHHAAERVAFGTFESVGGELEASGEPPWLGEVRVRGNRLPAAEVDALFHSPYALRTGRDAQGLTAAATAALVRAMLDDTPTLCHVPGVDGMAGGYPALVDRSGIELALPDDITRAEARAVNNAAACWDGVERIEEDGTVVYTREAADARAETLGYRVEKLAPDDHDAEADELLARLDALAR
jgi:hypothetical protein